MKTPTPKKKTATGRPKELFDTRQMLTVAQLFYKDEIKKQDIGDKLGIDSRKVTALLEEARKRGLVRIDIHHTTEGDLANAIQTLYRHLIKVMIVPGPPTRTEKQYAEFQRRAALVGADYFDELVKQQKRGQPLHVGTSGARTVLEFVNAVPQRNRENVFIHVTALIGTGRLPEATTLIHPIVNASILWNRCGSLPGHCEYATVSPYETEGPGPAALAAVKEELENLAARKAIRDVIEGMSQIDVAFASIGMVNPVNVSSSLRNKLTMTGLLKPMITVSELERQGALADLSYCLIDKDGNNRPDWRFFLTAGHGSKYSGVDFYRNMVEEGKKVVVMAGPFKVPAVKAALRGRLFNVLITDQDSAKQLAKG